MERNLSNTLKTPFRSRIPQLVTSRTFQSPLQFKKYFILKGRESVKLNESEFEGGNKNFDEFFEADGDDADDLLVNQLMKQITDITKKWAEAEARCAELEISVREEIANEFAQKYQQSEQVYMNLLLKEQNMNEEKLERKLELLSKDMDIPPNLETSKTRIQELEQENSKLVNELNQALALLEKERIEKQALWNKVTEFSELVLRNDVWLTDEFTDKEMMDNEEYVRFEDIEIGLEENETEVASEPLHNSFNYHSICSLESPKQVLPSPPPRLSKVRGKLYDTPVRSVSPKIITGPEEKIIVLRRQLHSVVAAENVNFVELNAVMSEIERMTISDLDTIKMSKMWKQMRQISVREFECDPYNTRCRAKRLLKRWEALQEKPFLEPFTELPPNLPSTVRRTSGVTCTTLNVEDENTDPNASHSKSIEAFKVNGDVEVQEKKKKRKLRAKKGLFEQDIDEKANEILSPSSAALTKGIIRRTR